jgi:hypothetical protein
VIVLFVNRVPLIRTWTAVEAQFRPERIELGLIVSP